MVDVEAKGNVTKPSNRRAVLFECIGMCLTLVGNIGFFAGWRNIDGSFDPCLGCKTIDRIVRVKIAIKLGGSGENGGKNHGGGR